MSDALDSFREVISSIPKEHSTLVLEIMNEINDTEYLDYVHGKRHTRNKGCTGPLCQKVLRDWRRTYRHRLNEETGRTTRPHARSGRYVEMDRILTDVQRAYNEAIDTAHTAPEELQTAGAA